MKRVLSKERLCDVLSSGINSGSNSFINERISYDNNYGQDRLAENESLPHNTKVSSDLFESVQNSVSKELRSPTDKIVNAEIKDHGTINGSVMKTEFVVHRTRYFFLFLFSMCSLINGFQWIQFAIITSTMTCYYNVSPTAVNWTSLIFMAAYLPLTFPVAWFMHVKGLRFTLILGSSLNCLSSCVQCLSLAPSRFYLVMITQTIAAVSQTFIVSVPPLLAATWFGSEEVSLACAFGVFGNQLGNALGFIIPPILVSHDCTHVKHVTSGLRHLAYGLTAVNTLLFFLVLIAFKNKPKQPPSLAEANKPEVNVISFRETFRLLKSAQYMLLFSNYGIILSVYFAIGTLLNQMVTEFFPGKEVEAGLMGLISVFAGMIGSVIYGYILDKTYRFRETSLAVNIFSLITIVTYTGLAHLKYIWIHFLMIALIGFSMSGYIPVGFEYGSEITYPQPEGDSASLLNASAQIYGLIITGIATWLLQSYGVIASNLFFCGCIFLACMLCVFLKAKLLRRQEYEVVSSTGNA